MRVPVSLPSRGSAGPPRPGLGPATPGRGGQEGFTARKALGEGTGLPLALGWFGLKRSATAIQICLEQPPLNCSQRDSPVPSHHPRASLTNPALNPCLACPPRGLGAPWSCPGPGGACGSSERAGPGLGGRGAPRCPGVPEGARGSRRGPCRWPGRAAGGGRGWGRRAEPREEARVKGGERRSQPRCQPRPEPPSPPQRGCPRRRPGTGAALGGCCGSLGHPPFRPARQPSPGQGRARPGVRRRRGSGSHGAGHGAPLRAVLGWGIPARPCGALRLRAEDAR